MFRHPSYYKKLKASLKKEAISPDESTDSDGRAPSPRANKPTSQQADKPTSEQADKPASAQASSGSRINKRSI
tara:strand:- start:5 stop:223 length:219 start_codon:yes stop_codon:yes gene_type:complete